MTVADKLNQYAEFKAQEYLLTTEEQKMLDSVIPPEIKQIMADLQKQIDEIMAPYTKLQEEVRAEFAGKGQAVLDNIAKLEAEIKDETEKAGATQKGNYFQCIYKPGGHTVAAKDVELVASHYDKIDKDVAAMIRSVIRPKASSSYIQAVGK